MKEIFIYFFDDTWLSQRDSDEGFISLSEHGKLTENSRCFLSFEEILNREQVFVCDYRIVLLSTILFLRELPTIVTRWR